MISATVAGNLGKDAETKTVGGSTVTKFSIASTQKTKGEEKTTWVSCDYWGKSGDAVAKYLTKGKQVVACGSLSTREYDGKTYIEMRVNELKLMGGQSEGGGGQRTQSRPATSSKSGGGFDDPGFGGGDDEDSIPF